MSLPFYNLHIYSQLAGHGKILKYTEVSKVDGDNYEMN